MRVMHGDGSIGWRGTQKACGEGFRSEGSKTSGQPGVYIELSIEEEGKSVQGENHGAGSNEHAAGNGRERDPLA